PDLGGNFDTRLRQRVESAVAQPIDVAQGQPVRLECLAGTDDHPAARRVELHHEERLALRLAGAEAKSAALTDRIARNAFMPAEHAPVEMHDLARLRDAGTQPV